MKLELTVKLLIFSIVVSLGGWFIVRYFDPNYSPYIFFSIPAFLTVCQLCIIGLIHIYLGKDSAKATRFMFGSKVFKILASITYILICYKVIGLDTLFLVNFLVFYMLFIVFDSWLYIRCNKEQLKKIIE